MGYFICLQCHCATLVSDKPYELISLAVILWAAWRFSMMPTVLIAVGSSAIFRCLFEQI
ncbi:hypothetical protein JF634_11900 [Simonsiella muelleri]|uniref:hypothetical protein n=1 Tax=Simonsiella muelleri TaxID=72 RepID=UPI0001D09645|nr:hypothetical protein [Simonsiella muelleri]UBQ53835.1 hypothetical protein JF634_11900 [Simonsiella muelleri]